MDRLNDFIAAAWALRWVLTLGAALVTGAVIAEAVMRRQAVSR